MESITAQVDGPPTLRMHLYRDPSATGPEETRGWCFVVEEILESGAVKPVWDIWERTFAEIRRYPHLYVQGEVVWHSAEGKRVTLEMIAASG